MKRILVTGASGFLGTYLLADLAKLNVEVLAFSRYVRQSESSKLTWIKADITDESSLLSPEILEQLGTIDIIIHAAALYDLSSGREELYRQNVIGTSNILHLVRLLPSIPHFAHISTIAIAGCSNLNFDENTFDVGQSFPDDYASTKFAAEHMVRSANDIPSRSIYRLGIVVGSSIDGGMTKIDGPYTLQKVIRSLIPFRGIISKLKFMPLPYHEGSRLYLISVNIASHLIATLVLKVSDRVGITTFHVTGGGRGVSVRRIVQTMFAHYEIAAEPVPLPKAVLMPWVVKALGVPQNAGEYLHTRWSFSSKALEKELPTFRYPSFAHFAKRNMAYADTHLFSERKGKKS